MTTTLAQGARLARFRPTHLHWGLALLVFIAGLCWSRPRPVARSRFMPRSEAVSQAYTTLRTLRANNNSAEVFQLRRQALAVVLSGDDSLRQQWERRLAAARPRGVIISAGNSGPLSNAFINAYVLRRVLHCRLPVVIMHWGASEVGPAAAAFFKAHSVDVEFMDAASAYPEHHLPMWEEGGDRPSGKEIGYKIKIATLYQAPFREVLLLDSDSLPLQDVASLFDVPAYRRHGSLFWPDIRAERPGVWDLLSLSADDPWQLGIDSWEEEEEDPPRRIPRAVSKRGRAARRSAAAVSFFRLPGNETVATQRRQRQGETGQIVIDRARHWKVLEWALLLNTHDALVYHLPNMLGDTDIFRPAFALAGTPLDFRQIPHTPALPIIDRRLLNNSQDPRYAYAGLLQLHPDGSALFHHRTWFSKFPACGSHGELAGPLTHVSPPTSVAQAKTYESQRGLTEAQARALSCGEGGSCPQCSLHALAQVDEVCTGRTAVGTAAWGSVPVTLVEIPEGSYIHAASSAAAAAHKLLSLGGDGR